MFLMCNFKAGLAKCVVCFHFRFTSLKEDWKIMYIFSAKKKKFNKKGDTSTSSRKKCTQVLLQKFQSLFFFFYLSLAQNIFSGAWNSLLFCHFHFVLAPQTHLPCFQRGRNKQAAFWSLFSYYLSPFLSKPCLGVWCWAPAHLQQGTTSVLKPKRVSDCIALNGLEVTLV